MAQEKKLLRALTYPGVATLDGGIEIGQAQIVFTSGGRKTVVSVPMWGTDIAIDEADRMFDYLMCEITKDACSAGFSGRLQFSLQDMVNNEVFPSVCLAEAGFIDVMSYLMQIHFSIYSSRLRRIIKGDRDETSGALFYHAEIQGSMCCVNVNDEIDWRELTRAVKFKEERDE